MCWTTDPMSPSTIKGEIKSSGLSLCGTMCCVGEAVWYVSTLGDNETSRCLVNIIKVNCGSKGCDSWLWLV